MQFSNINTVPTFTPDLIFLTCCYMAIYLVTTATNDGNVRNIVINKYI